MNSRKFVYDMLTTEVNYGAAQLCSIRQALRDCPMDSHTPESVLQVLRELQGELESVLDALQDVDTIERPESGKTSSIDTSKSIPGATAESAQTESQRIHAEPDITCGCWVCEREYP